MRRFSTQVKLELDQTHLDLANRIRSYQIKGIRLTINHQDEELVLTNKENYEKILPIHMIQSNPSGVFKAIVSLM